VERNKRKTFFRLGQTSTEAKLTSNAKLPNVGRPNVGLAAADEDQLNQLEAEKADLLHLCCISGRPVRRNCVLLIGASSGWSVAPTSPSGPSGRHKPQAFLADLFSGSATETTDAAESVCLFVFFLLVLCYFGLFSVFPLQLWHFFPKNWLPQVALRSDWDH